MRDNSSFFEKEPSLHEKFLAELKKNLFFIEFEEDQFKKSDKEKTKDNESL